MIFNFDNFLVKISKVEIFILNRIIVNKFTIIYQLQLPTLYLQIAQEGHASFTREQVRDFSLVWNKDSRLMKQVPEHQETGGSRSE